MAEAPAEPAPEAPKEEEEQKVGRNLEDKILTCHCCQVVPPCMDLSEFPLKNYFAIAKWGVNLKSKQKRGGEILLE